ncbi:unnamed protein product [Symbiodinium sp. CCMP2592]|nr:unnamed protein product [Symbiodinium sp. CCMP2592]
MAEAVKAFFQALPLQHFFCFVCEQVEEGEDVCISLMLLGCMGFMMATFYLVNWPDDDIQQITWEIISSTTSIFGALLMFQGCNRVVHYYFLDHVSSWHQLVVNMLHMMLWFCVLQLVLAYYSGAVGQQEAPAARRAALSRASCDIPLRSVHLECAEKHLHQIRLNTHAWAVLLGHVTGFAAVNAWSSVQQAIPRALCPAVPVAAYLGISYIYRTTARWRYERTMADGEEDEYEEIWGECVAETEDEVISLSVSFLIAQVLRLCITGELPGLSGEDTEGTWHSTANCVLLLSVGLVLGVSELARLAYARSRGKAAPSDEETEDRSANWYQKIAAMSFGWCFHISVDWWVASSLHMDKSMKAVVSALAGTCFAFLLIFGLDKVADMNAHDAEVDCALRTIITALGMLVGISWERCFDAAVAGVAEKHVGRLPPPVMNLLLAILLAAMVLPAWKWYIHPKLHNEHQQEGEDVGSDLGEATRLFGRLGDSHPIICRTAKADLYDVVPLSCRPGPEEDDSEKKSHEKCIEAVSGNLKAAPVDTSLPSADEVGLEARDFQSQNPQLSSTSEACPVGKEVYLLPDDLDDLDVVSLGMPNRLCSAPVFGKCKSTLVSI